jgi:hypothetical protein
VEAPIFSNSGDNLQFAFENPIKDQKAILNYNSKNSKELWFTLFSIDGKKLISQKVDRNQGTLELILPFPKGLYLFEMMGDKGRKIEKVVIE